MNPYSKLPRERFWRTGVAECDASSFEGIHLPKWEIATTDTIATMGSCFAQHIGNKLKSLGFSIPYFDNPKMVKAQNYSANYGNIYTVRQAYQLIKECVGKHCPSESHWKGKAGYIDPFRPNVFAEDFTSIYHLNRARAEHLKAVLEVIKRADVLVFTMGLTEAWIVNECGSVLPTAPGVLGGEYQEDRYSFKNFSYSEVLTDLNGLIDLINQIRDNNQIKVLLTVSPVPLTATAEKRHVLQSTAYSKAVLRAVAGDITNNNEHIDYFPSYEIVTNPKTIESNYQNNLRNVSTSAVENVMAYFEHSYFTDNKKCPDGLVTSGENTNILYLDDAGNVDCEDALLEQFAESKSGNTIEVLDSEILVFGNSHIASFKSALSKTSLINHTCFAAVNFLDRDPLSDPEIEKCRFREFIFSHPAFGSFRAPNAKYLIIVGFGLFGNAIISSLGAVDAGYEGCTGESINVQLEIGKKLDESEISRYRRRISDLTNAIQKVSQLAGFEKIYWIISPDFPEPCARFRLGDAFVDSGTYKEIKSSYYGLFKECCAEFYDRVEFIFFDREIDGETGFIKSQYANKKPWDIHPNEGAYKSMVEYLEHQLHLHNLAA